MFGAALRLANRHSDRLLAGGLGAVAAYNWLLWRRDRALAQRLGGTRTAPPALRRTPRVSALVAAWNERDRIDAHIRSFLALRYPNIELILCAGGTDDTLTRARSYAGDRVVVLEQRAGEGKQQALARCLERASGEVVYLTDADCCYDDDALARLLAPIVEDGERATTGRSHPADSQRDKLLPRYLWSSDVVASAHMPLYCRGLLGRNAAITREALEQSGGLRFPARTGTDYQLAQRLLRDGTAIHYVAESSVPTHYPETVRAYRHKQSRWLRNLLIHGRRYGAADDVAATIRTVGAGALMLALPLAAARLGRGVLVLWSLLVAHAASSKLRYVLFASRLHRRPVPARLLLGLVPLTLLDFAVWTLPILDLLHERRRERW